MNPEITIIKLNVERQETWRYSGAVLKRWPNAILIESLFNRDDVPFHGITLKRGDRFVELYYSDRWYNIFEIYDRDDGSKKAWYCNVTLPAELHPDRVVYVDLALDLLVFPDGRQLVLDEDEFEALALDDKTRSGARQALADLQKLLQSPDIFPEGML